MAVLLWLSVAIPLLLAVWLLPSFLVDYYRKWRSMRAFPPPQLPPHWLWGNVAQLRPDEETLLRLTEYMHENKYKVAAGWVGLFPSLYIVHPEPAKVALKEPKLHNVYRLFHPWLGEGLLTVEDGPKWHRNRHLLTPAFHFAILKGYVPVYNSCLQHLFQKWDVIAGGNDPVMLFDTISSISLDIIMQCAFSFRSNCQKEGTRPPYIKCVYQLVETVSNRFLNPIYYFDWIYFLTPTGRRMKDACKIVHAHAEMVIKERRQVLGLEHGKGAIDSQKLLDTIAKSRKLDFLDILLTATDEDGVGLTDLEIRNEVDTFMFEGHDTTTSGVCWTLYCLAKYPEHQDKVREEVRNVLAGRECLEYDDLKDLKYTQWCIKEAMRLYPPVFTIFRETQSEIELDGHKVPKGVWLVIAIVSMHRNPEIWPNPEEFDPLRLNRAMQWFVILTPTWPSLQALETALDRTLPLMRRE